MSDIMTHLQCKENKENCYKFNIAPIMEEIKNINTKIDALIITTTKFGERIKPLERIVYGAVGAGLMFLIGKIFKLL